MQTPKILNVAVVAFGMSAQVFHCPSIASLPNKLKLVYAIFNFCFILNFNTNSACVERSSKKSQSIYPSIAVFSSLDDLFKSDQVHVDLVVITSPNTSHFEFAQKCILAGKHVIVEKPFTTTSEEAYQLCDLAKKHSKIVSVYHNRRFDGDFMTVKKLISKNMLGTIVEFDSHFDRFRNKPKPNYAWREGTN